MYEKASRSSLLKGLDKRDASRANFFLTCSCSGIHLRSCLKRSSSSQPTQHQASHSNVNHRFTTGGEPFIILAQTPSLGQPGESSLHHPASGQDHKAFLALGAQDGLQDEVEMLLHPLQQATSIGAVNPQTAQFLTGSP